MKGSIGERRIKNFSRLHSALQDTNDVDSIWEAYQEVRNFKRDQELLSEEVLRLMVVHFKEATKPASALFNPHRDRSLQSDIWCARIVTVLNDKRILFRECTRWDYSDLMSALNRLERYEESVQEFERVTNANTIIDPILLNHVVRAWGGLGQLDKAVEIIHDTMSRFDMKPSEYTLGYLTQQYILSGDMAKATLFWKEMVDSQTLKNIVVVNGILRACVSIQESNFAQIVYDALPCLKIESDLESLNLMLSLAVAEIQYPEERAEFLAAIQAKIIANDTQVFDRVTLESILTDFSKKGDVEGAGLVYQIMSKYGFQPGVGEHNKILHCYARSEQHGMAVDWFLKMRRFGIQPNRYSYELLTQLYTRLRLPQETEALFRQSLVDGIKPDLTICNHLLLAYEQAKMNRRCLSLYKIMFQDQSIGLDHFSFSCMFNAVFHNDKATLEGGDGRDGQGSLFQDFMRKISEPIQPPTAFTQQTGLVVDNDDSQNGLYINSPYQFENADSTTKYLNPRTLFRDMIIVGVRPSRSLYSNILRAFFSQNDFAGAAVALRVLVDYFVLRPTPKMNAIVATWVYQTLKKRGIDSNSPLTSKDLSKLVSMMERTRGLIEILEKVVYIEQHAAEIAVGKTLSSIITSRGLTNGEKLETTHNDMSLLKQAKTEMGGDLVDLFSRSDQAGSSWNTMENDPMNIDTKDFERWYRAYSNRIVT
ncbi:hypothetical protein BGZ76_011191 [Entomortierella beljakovae]|nr:hypothetical protein BGZ76_011191 [Entomortierella beljakovae]